LGQAASSFEDRLLIARRPPARGVRLDWARMAEHLELVYAWRSRDLHDGTPIPEPMCEPPQQLDGHPAPIEVPFGMATWTGSATWTKADIPILLHTLRVHHSRHPAQLAGGHDHRDDDWGPSPHGRPPGAGR
jgi:hypothetical protein